jgi:large subunit ribosomal protein L17
MNHRKGYSRLGLPTARRLALLRNLATDLIENQVIVTTLARAKALQPYVEKLLTKTKEDTPHHRAQLKRYLKTKDSLKLAFEKVGPLIKDRPGGYTRVVRCGLPRVGDGARLALIELVDRHGSSSEEPLRKKKQSSKKTEPLVIELGEENTKATSEEIVTETINEVEEEGSSALSSQPKTK